MPIADEALIALARQKLDERAAALGALTLGPTVETTFSLGDLSHDAAKYLVDTWLSDEVWPYPKEQPTLYVFRLADAAAADRLLQKFPERSNRDFAAPRKNDGTDGSAALYVGSSEDVKKRLREHLWQAHRMTYALHLARWCKGAEGPVLVSVQPILNGAGREVRQDLEDTIWSQLRPKLGRSGGR